ncbi:MAG: M48 family metalloprotease [Helicobacteraceae bacterium]|jgi:predicted Zn-dependent protease|nr:M48 family metalloprotease [Helicobacteraceae bacterium]
MRLNAVFVAIVSLAALAGCQAVMSITDSGAQIGKSLGLVDADHADAISKSSKAIAKAAEEFTPEQEYYIGRSVGANILTFYKPYTKDKALTNYLNSICNAIAINSSMPEIYNGYHIIALDSDEINAFATSGGHIFVTRGLIAAAKNEDALAAVIAHEIAHIQLHHSIGAIDKSRVTEAIWITSQSALQVAGKKNADLARLSAVFNESVNDIVTTLVRNGYSQSQEFDADAKALELLVLAGYDPNALIEMLEALKISQSKHTGGFNKTHPTPQKRIDNANGKLSAYAKTQDTRKYRLARYKTVL